MSVHKPSAKERISSNDFNIARTPKSELISQEVSNIMNDIWSNKKPQIALFAVLTLPLFPIVWPLAYVYLKDSVKKCAKKEVVNTIAAKRIELLNGTLKTAKENPTPNKELMELVSDETKINIIPEKHIRDSLVETIITNGDRDIKRYFKKSHEDMLLFHSTGQKTSDKLSPKKNWDNIKNEYNRVSQENKTLKERVKSALGINNDDVNLMIQKYALSRFSVPFCIDDENNGEKEEEAFHLAEVQSTVEKIKTQSGPTDSNRPGDARITSNRETINRLKAQHLINFLSDTSNVNTMLKTAAEAGEEFKKIANQTNTAKTFKEISEDISAGVQEAIIKAVENINDIETTPFELSIEGLEEKLPVYQVTMRDAPHRLPAFRIGEEQYPPSPRYEADTYGWIHLDENNQLDTDGKKDETKTAQMMNSVTLKEMIDLYKKIIKANPDLSEPNRMRLWAFLQLSRTQQIGSPRSVPIQLHTGLILPKAEGTNFKKDGGIPEDKQHTALKYEYDQTTSTLSVTSSQRDSFLVTESDTPVPYYLYSSVKMDLKMTDDTITPTCSLVGLKAISKGKETFFDSLPKGHDEIARIDGNTIIFQSGQVGELDNLDIGKGKEKDNSK